MRPMLSKLAKLFITSAAGTQAVQYTTVRQSMSYQHRPVQLSTTTQSTNTTIELSDCSAMKMCNIEQTHAITLVSVLTVGANTHQYRRLSTITVMYRTNTSPHTLVSVLTVGANTHQYRRLSTITVMYRTNTSPHTH